MAKTMKIAFPNGGIVPASVLKADADKRLGPHEPVSVPEAYGQSLVADRFAYAYDPRTAPRAPADPVKVAEEKAAKIVADAEAKARALVSDAEKKADEMVRTAETKAAGGAPSGESKTDDGKTGGGKSPEGGAAGES